MTPIVLIPARMAATRLPGKPLADIGGLPMIVRVLRQAEAAGVGPVAENPPGFDRAAFHAKLNAELAAFFLRTLAATAGK